MNLEFFMKSVQYFGCKSPSVFSRLSFVFGAVLVSMATLSPSFAAPGGTSSGGGQTIQTGTVNSLRELVDPSAVCSWRTGRDLIRANQTAWDSMVAILDQGNWIFSELVQAEVSHLKFCLTQGDLPTVQWSADSDVTPYTRDSKQIAIRHGDTVYMNSILEGEMSEHDRAYLLLHEALHGLMENSEGKMIRLRSMVAYVQSLEGTTIYNFNFDQALKDNHIQVPSASLRSDRDRGIYGRAFLHAYLQFISSEDDAALMQALGTQFAFGEFSSCVPSETRMPRHPENIQKIREYI
jgi:hypothetical protein